MPAVLPKGTVIAGLQVGSVLGQGGFGITYLAYDPNSKRKLALKEYFPSDHAVRNSNGSVEADAQSKQVFDYGLKAFLAEANVLKSLPRQRGLVRVRGAFKKQGTAYCVMEYIEGDPLDKMTARLMQANGYIPEELVMNLLDPILDALRAIHEKKLIHCDIKPGNVMIRRTGEPVLIDFGAAKNYGKKLDGAVMYTQKYAALEQFPDDGNQLTKGLQEGPWSDLYALSVILYEILAQRTPPDALTRMKSLQDNGVDPYQPLVSVLKGKQYSIDLLTLVDMGCKLTPQQRPNSVQEYRAIYQRPIASHQAQDRQGFDENAAKFTPKKRSTSDRGQAKSKQPAKASSRVSSMIKMGLLMIFLAILSIGYGMWSGQ